MGQGILLSGGDNIDFMIHGVFSYNLFGQEVWITTSHICLLIVVLVLLLFFIIGGVGIVVLDTLLRRFSKNFSPARFARRRELRKRINEICDEIKNSSEPEKVLEKYKNM